MSSKVLIDRMEGVADLRELERAELEEIFRSDAELMQFIDEEQAKVEEQLRKELVFPYHIPFEGDKEALIAAETEYAEGFLYAEPEYDTF